MTSELQVQQTIIQGRNVTIEVQNFFYFLMHFISQMSLLLLCTFLPEDIGEEIHKTFKPKLLRFK